MPARKIIQLRRRQLPVRDPADNVTLHALVLRCCACGETWQAGLGEFGDEVPAEQARCTRCNPEPPRAA